MAPSLPIAYPSSTYCGWSVTLIPCTSTFASSFSPEIWASIRPCFILDRHCPFTLAKRASTSKLITASRGSKAARIEVGSNFDTSLLLIGGSLDDRHQLILNLDSPLNPHPKRTELKAYAGLTAGRKGGCSSLPAFLVTRP